MAVKKTYVCDICKSEYSQENLVRHREVPSSSFGSHFNYTSIHACYLCWNEIKEAVLVTIKDIVRKLKEK